MVNARLHRLPRGLLRIRRKGLQKTQAKSRLEGMPAVTPPPDVNPGSFRRIMGLFPTGVTVLAAQHGEDIHGMTANAVASVSLEPLLLLACVAKSARMNSFIERSGGFSLNVLSADQEVLSRYFAGSWKVTPPPEFRFTPWDGGPRLVGSLATIGCRLDRSIEAGDHWIVLGRVIALHEGDRSARPLLFFAGRYRRLSDLAEGVPAEPWSDEAVRIHYGERRNRGHRPSRPTG